MTVLVAHPGRQHSHQLAVALHKRGVLAGYWAGVPALRSHARFVPPRLWRSLMRYGDVPLPEHLVRWNPVAPALIKLANSCLSLHRAKAVEFKGYEWFDQWVARRMRGCNGVHAFVGYETATLASFKAAKQAGMTTVLDAASIHHTAQDRLHPFIESAEVHGRICALKDAEIALADHILTVSELARQTYLEGSVPPAKVHAVALGADLDIFRPDPGTDRRGHPFTFVFVGSMIQRKGLDLLLQSYDAVRARHPDVRLTLVGGGGDAQSLLEPPRAGVAYLGPLTQAALSAHYRESDCFVLPSRNDSFGMVVPEALGSGVPVIVSDMVGAKDVVRDGVNGWVIPHDDLAALTSRMLWCAENADAVRSMRHAAHLSVKALAWAAYHERVAELLARIGVLR